MKALWIYADADGKSRIKPLPLPIHKITRPLDAEMFRRQARGENIGRPPRLSPSTGLRSIRISGKQKDPWRTADSRQLVFVLSGCIELTASDGTTALLGPSDILFEDDLSGQGHYIHWRGDCRLLLLGVSDAWVPTGDVTPATTDASVRAAKEQPMLRRMYRASDNKAYFRAFDQLFADPVASLSTVRPVVGFQFVQLPPGAFVDWHPEVVNNFVVVMTGELELEVSGDHAVEVFGPGDVCLAEDRTGEGHIDRAHGEVRLACIQFEDQHLWATPA